LALEKWITISTKELVEEIMFMRLLNKFGVVVIAILLAGSFSACKKKTAGDILSPEFDTGNNPGTRTNFEDTNNSENLPNLSDAELDRILFGDSGLDGIYFDYNSFALRPDSLDVLKRNSELIRQTPGLIIQIEGHCDERGTQEYNLALGEKRALAVRSHLINLGVSGDRLITISYGEEDPANMGHDESAWSQNRRAEFNRAL
jgi:peptidoglycan-associated lipoprotein